MKLVDCFIPVLAVVRQFVQGPQAPQDDAATLAARLQPLLAAAQQQAVAIGVPEEDVRGALFAVAAWTDEALLTCGWPHAPAWQRMLLQRQFFGVSNGGVAFFERLAAFGDGHADVQEVYVLCLSMGFRGRFGYQSDGVDAGDEAHAGQARDSRELADLRLRAIRRVLAHASARGVPEAAALVFPGVKPTPSAGPGRHRARWLPSRLSVAVLSISLLALVALYFVFFSILKQQVHAVLPMIR